MHQEEKAKKSQMFECSLCLREGPPITHLSSYDTLNPSLYRHQQPLQENFKQTSACIGPTFSLSPTFDNSDLWAHVPTSAGQQYLAAVQSSCALGKAGFWVTAPILLLSECH